MPKRVRQRGRGVIADAAKAMKALKGVRGAQRVLGAKSLKDLITSGVATYDSANHAHELINGREEKPRTWLDTAKEYGSAAFSAYKTASDYTRPSVILKGIDQAFLSDGIGTQKSDLRHAVGAAADALSLAGHGRHRRKRTRR